MMQNLKNFSFDEGNILTDVSLSLQHKTNTFFSSYPQVDDRRFGGVDEQLSTSASFFNRFKEALIGKMTVILILWKTRNFSN